MGKGRFMEKNAEKPHGQSSSSDSQDRKMETAMLKDKDYRIFLRENSSHKILGSGKPADVLLWKDKKLSAGVFGGATAIWVWFAVLEYHLLTLLCHGLILGLCILFIWSNYTHFINKTPLHIREVWIPHGPVQEIASAFSKYINQGFATMRDIALARDLKKFPVVIAGLLVMSVLGSCYYFLTLLYTITVALFIIPLIYQKFENFLDSVSSVKMTFNINIIEGSSQDGNTAVVSGENSNQEGNQNRINSDINLSKDQATSSGRMSRSRDMVQGILAINSSK